MKRLLIYATFTMSITGAMAVERLDSHTFPMEKNLKDRTTDEPISYFQSDILRSDQGNVASGQQEIKISIPVSSKFPVHILGSKMHPGQSQAFSVNAEANGSVKFAVYPAATGVSGVTVYDVTIASIKSGQDRFWEATNPTYGDWVDTGRDVDVSAWKPAIAYQMGDFLQVQTYNDIFSMSVQQREKERVTSAYRNVGSPTSEDKKVPESRTRSVFATHSEWVDDGSIQNCEEWKPLVSTVKYGTTFEQTKLCYQPQVRDWAYKVDGVALHRHSEPRQKNVTSTQQATGTKNYITGPKNSTWSAWKNDPAASARYGYSSWSPSPSAVNKGHRFTQSQTYKQKQFMTRTLFDLWADGTKTENSTETQRRTIDATNTRSATGTKVVGGKWTYVTSQRLFLRGLNPTMKHPTLGITVPTYRASPPTGGFCPTIGSYAIYWLPGGANFIYAQTMKCQ
ncbi:exported hypothetical protein [Vibrio crassostreae]|nr:exported hypothetical protein [Vibrio crassostreae]